jgi:hypothetical protein
VIWRVAIDGGFHALGVKVSEETIATENEVHRSYFDKPFDLGCRNESANADETPSDIVSNHLTQKSLFRGYFGLTYS